MKGEETKVRGTKSLCVSQCTYCFVVVNKNLYKSSNRCLPYFYCTLLDIQGSLPLQNAVKRGSITSPFYEIYIVQSDTASFLLIQEQHHHHHSSLSCPTSSPRDTTIPASHAHSTAPRRCWPLPILTGREHTRSLSAKLSPV